MAINREVKCNQCSHNFSIYSGHGFYFTICRCEDCGEEKRIDHPERRGYQVVLNAEQLRLCEKCGGKISKNADYRCPKCKSKDLAIDEDSGYSID